MNRVPAGLMTTLEKVASGPYGEREAWLYNDESVTFVELRDRCYSIANGLKAAGIGKGDRVAVFMRNCMQWVELFYGIAELGAVCVPVNVLLRPNEIKYLCEDADIDAFVVDLAGVERFEQAGARPRVVIGVGGAEPSIPGARTVPFVQLRDGAPTPNPDPPQKEDLLVLYYSSGTTGLPKAAIHTHDTVVWNSFAQIVDQGWSADETYLVVPSFSWAAGFHSQTLACSFTGGRCVVMPTGGVTVEKVVDLCRRTGVTRTFLVPTLIRDLLASPAALQGVRESKLNWIITGSEPIDRATLVKLKAELPDVLLLQAYGMSEFPTVTTMLHPEYAVERVGSAGRASSTLRLAVELPSGEIVDRGEGELVFRSRASTIGYWNRPEENERVFKNGWLHTGDVGVIDDEGFVTITGRTKDMIISGGLNVYPSETEAVIVQMDGVVEVAVVAMADARLGEVPAAVIVPGEGVPSEATVIAHCRELLASYKVPKRVFFYETPLPRNSNGKLLKRELRPWVAELAGAEAPAS
jgi:acyl-CoA synthetase (AMP-forming)/AMP-acid ligase II